MSAFSTNRITADGFVGAVFASEKSTIFSFPQESLVQLVKVVKGV